MYNGLSVITLETISVLFISIENNLLLADYHAHWNIVNIASRLTSLFLFALVYSSFPCPGLPEVCLPFWYFDFTDFFLIFIF